MAKKERTYKRAGDIDLTPAQEAKALAAIEQADSEIEAVRVNFRWNRKQLDLVKKAAELSGSSYQTYIKHVLYDRAMHDLEKASKLAVYIEAE